jgi:hypothetical protein
LCCRTALEGLVAALGKKKIIMESFLSILKIPKKQFLEFSRILPVTDIRSTGVSKCPPTAVVRRSWKQKLRILS